jgi:hypothetical protein
LNHDAETLRDASLEGVILGYISATDKTGATHEELKTHLIRTLGLDEKDTLEILKTSLSNLRASKLVIRQRNPGRSEVFLADKLKIENPLSDAIKSLVSAVDGRLSLLYGVRSTSDMRLCIQATLTTVIEARGWDLGAAFLGGTTPVDIDIEHHVREAGALLTLDKLANISGAIRHLFGLPTPSEAKLLAEIGRASFAISLICSAPRTAISQGSLLPEKIYLDASILLPALVPGHRFNPLYRTTIDSLAKLARNAGQRVRLLAYEGYLNEVVSHKTKALREYEFEQEGFREYAIRRAKLEGAHNLNVFIGGYVQRANENPDLSFLSYLEQVAPYATEADLASYVQKLGIHVADRNEIVGDRVGDISYELTKAYSSDGEKFKYSKLIDHDAVQLSALSTEAQQGQRSLWVSADMRLRSKLKGDLLGPVADHVISHIGLSQLVEFISNYQAPTLGMAGLLWGVTPSSQTARVRDLLISDALEFYDEAYAMEMHQLVDSVAERWERETRRRGVSLDSTDPSSRTEALRLVGGYQDQFINALNEKIEKRRAEKH